MISEEYNENSTWVTYEGKLIKFKDLTDNHLNNIIYHMRNYSWVYPMTLFTYLLVMAVKRGIKDPGMHQIPHLNQEGKLAVWDYETHQPKLYEGAT